jgi:hypothetical protein
MTLAQPPPEGRVSPDDEAASLAETFRAEVNPRHVIFFVESLEAPHREGRIGQVVPLNCGTFQRKPPLPVDEGRSVQPERARTGPGSLTGSIDFANGSPSTERIAAPYRFDWATASRSPP